MLRRAEAAPAGVEFIPFSLEASGVWGPAARRFFAKCLYLADDDRDIDVYPTYYLGVASSRRLPKLQCWYSRIPTRRTRGYRYTTRGGQADSPMARPARRSAAPRHQHQPGLRAAASSSAEHGESGCPIFVHRPGSSLHNCTNIQCGAMHTHLPRVIKHPDRGMVLVRVRLVLGPAWAHCVGHGRSQSVLCPSETLQR
jgi:hypothetical protein